MLLTTFRQLSAALRYPRALIPNGSGRLLPARHGQQPCPFADACTAAARSQQRRNCELVRFRRVPGKAARGSWLEIDGANLAQGKREWGPSDFVDGMAPTFAQRDASVTVGGKSAYVFLYVSPGQVNVQALDTVTAGTLDVAVTSPLGSSIAYKLTVDDVQPGLFAPASLATDGKQYAGVVLADRSLATAGLRRARPGDTGDTLRHRLWRRAPNLGAGEIVRSANAVVMPLQVFFGEYQPATVTLRRSCSRCTGTSSDQRGRPGGARK